MLSGMLADGTPFSFRLTTTRFESDTDPGANGFAGTINVVLGPAPWGPADLGAPFGTVSQSDVASFVPLFFADDPRVSVLAPPFNVTSQADVDAFVRLFFEGCPQ
ncbi:MAG: hypothetical protein AAFR38_10465 [Planctomycetota bacterium]